MPDFNQSLKRLREFYSRIEHERRKAILIAPLPLRKRRRTQQGHAKQNPKQ